MLKESHCRNCSYQSVCKNGTDGIAAAGKTEMTKGGEVGPVFLNRQTFREYE